MIHTARQSPKFTRLVRRLRGLIDCPLIDTETLAVGILERLWHMAISGAQRGDIGRHDNETIAEAVGWFGDADTLIELLTDTEWVDRCDENRLVIHDWDEHAPAFVKRNIARKGGFAKPLTNPVKQALPYSGEQGSERLPTQKGAQAATPNQTKPNLTKDSTGKGRPSGSAGKPAGTYPDWFEDWWRTYPPNKAGRKRGKRAAYGLAQRIPADDRIALAQATRNYAAECEADFVRDPERFLRADWWRDHIGEAKPATNGYKPRGPTPEQVTESKRRTLIKAGVDDARNWTAAEVAAKWKEQNSTL